MCAKQHAYIWGRGLRSAFDDSTEAVQMLISPG